MAWIVDLRSTTLTEACNHRVVSRISAARQAFLLSSTGPAADPPITGSERPHKSGSEFHPLRATGVKSAKSDFSAYMQIMDEDSASAKAAAEQAQRYHALHAYTSQ
jgi:hypothetical protein